MRINLANNYVVDVDEFNHTLKKHIPSHTKRDGIRSKDRHDVVGYYPNLSQAINKAVNEGVRDGSDTLSMRKFLHKYNEVVSEFITYLEENYDNQNNC